MSPGRLCWPSPTCTITHSARSRACFVARAHWSSVATSHTGVGAWGRGRRGSGHATSALGSWRSPSTSTSRRMYRRAAGGWYAAPCGGGGEAALMAVAPHVEVQAVRGHLRASLGCLLSPPGVQGASGGGPACLWREKGGPGRHATRDGRWAPVCSGSSGGAHRGSVGGTPVPLLATGRRFWGRGNAARGARAMASCVTPSGGTCRGAAAWRCAA